jgi:hypothetical protein
MGRRDLNTTIGELIIMSPTGSPETKAETAAADLISDCLTGQGSKMLLELPSSSTSSNCLMVLIDRLMLLG